MRFLCKIKIEGKVLNPTENYQEAMKQKTPHATLIFPYFKYIEFSKDPGFLMHYLAKQGFTSEILTLKLGDQQRKEFIPKLTFIKKPFFLNAIWHLVKNAKKTDALIMFHTHPLNIFYGPLYKLLNPKGTTYLKSDMDNTLLNINKPTLLNYIRRIKLYFNLLHVDVFSTEQEKVYKLFLKRYPQFRQKMMHVPNGYGDYITVEKKPFSQKENIILTVGPVGSHQKGTDIIFKTFERLKPELENGWTVIMIGEILDEYKQTLDNFFERNPTLKKRIILRGHVKDRKEMLDLYNKAKLIFMPSRWETFSCALTEAAYYGVVIVGTPVGGVAELTGNGAYGAVCDFNDDKNLAKELKKRMRDSTLLKKESNLTQQHSHTYTWPVISKKVYERLTKEMKKKKQQNK